MRFLGFVPDDIASIPDEALGFVADQVDAAPHELLAYGTRATRSGTPLHYYTRRDPDHTVRNLVRKLEALGHEVTRSRFRSSNCTTSELWAHGSRPSAG